MRVLCVFGQHSYGDPSRGEGYEYSNFIPALRRLGHEILFLENRNRSCFRDFRELNETLLRMVEENRPDVVFTVQTYYEIWLETWKILLNAAIAATVNWATDDSWRYNELSRFIAPFFHAFTTTYPDVYTRYQRDGISHVLLTQWAANAANLQPPLSMSGEEHQKGLAALAKAQCPPVIHATKKHFPRKLVILKHVLIQFVPGSPARTERSEDLFHRWAMFAIRKAAFAHNTLR